MHSRPSPAHQASSSAALSFRRASAAGQEQQEESAVSPGREARTILATGFNPPQSRKMECKRPMNLTVWKIRPQFDVYPRTKPVIAGDTTYGISFLTGTISWGNF